MNDIYINSLIKISKLAPTKSSSISWHEFENKSGINFLELGNDNCFSVLNDLVKDGYLDQGEVECPEFKDKKKKQVRWQTYYISFKGRAFLHDLDRNERAQKLSKIAICVAFLSTLLTIYYSLLDFYGDKNWQKDQLQVLKEINKNLK